MKVLIIGHKGSYGSWLVSVLKEFTEGYDIRGIDREQTKDEKQFAEIVSSFDVVINASSICSSKGVIKFVVKHIPKNGLIVDITSSKKEVHPILKDCGIDNLMIHPMSSPPIGLNPLNGDNKVYLVDVNQPKSQENIDFWCNFKNAVGGQYVVVSLETHNKIEELNQAVVHNLLLQFAKAIEASGFSYEEARKNATPVSIYMYDALDRFMHKGNPDTTAQLMKLSVTHNSKIFKSIIAVSNRIRDVGPQYIYSIKELFRRLKKNIF